MPRKPRFFIDKVPVHIVHRGHYSDPYRFDRFIAVAVQSFGLNDLNVMNANET
jgi:hypothetical protein